MKYALPPSPDQSVMPPRVPSHVLVRLLAGGGKGDVWFACDAHGVYRAVKIIYRSRFEDDNTYGWERHDAIKYEAVSLTHPGLADVVQVGESEGLDYCYSVMELADDGGGSSMAALNPDTYHPRTLQTDRDQYGRSSLQECLKAALNLTGALQQVHQQQWLISDSHPARIIFVGGVAKLTALARQADSPNARQTKGQEAFFPPEGMGKPSGDIYALGKALYEMATGYEARQFPAWPTESEWKTAAGQDFKQTILKACAPKDADRYVNVTEWQADLMSVQRGQRVKRFQRKPPLLWSAGLVLAVIGAVAGASFWMKARPESKNETSLASPPSPSPTSSPTRSPQTPSPPPRSALPALPPSVVKPTAVAGKNMKWRPGKNLFEENFDTNSAGQWLIKKTSNDTKAVFAYDYSVMGIPNAPGAERSLGLQLAANLALPKKKEIIGLSPVGKKFTGNYRLRFHLWMNMTGPFPDGGLGSTQYFMAGLGTDGKRLHLADGKYGTDDAIWFMLNGDGDAGSRSDFFAYAGTRVFEVPAATVYAAGQDASARANLHPYYASKFSGGQTPPPAQKKQYPTTQTGGLAVGSVGMAWREVEITKLYETIHWNMDGLRIATVEINGEPLSDNIFIGYADIVPSVATQPELCFAVVENLVVEEMLPENAK